MEETLDARYGKTRVRAMVFLSLLKLTLCDRVLVQILLHYTFVAAPKPIIHSEAAPASEPDAGDRSRKRKRKALRNSSPESRVAIKKKHRGRGRKRSESPTAETELIPEENLDMLTDRMAIWQAVEEEGEKFLKREGDGERDWMTVFCEDVVHVL
jgi:hypothetical protein